MSEPQNTDQAAERGGESATLTDEEIETRPIATTGPTASVGDDGDDSGDTGDDTGDPSDTSDTGDDSGDPTDTGDDSG